jgi:hypothetical protein
MKAKKVLDLIKGRGMEWEAAGGIIYCFMDNYQISIGKHTIVHPPHFAFSNPHFELRIKSNGLEIYNLWDEPEIGATYKEIQQKLETIEQEKIEEEQKRFDDYMTKSRNLFDAYVEARTCEK